MKGTILSNFEIMKSVSIMHFWKAKITVAFLKFETYLKTAVKGAAVM